MRYRFVVVTVSDTRAANEQDRSGPLAEDLLSGMGLTSTGFRMGTSDDGALIASTLREAAAKADLVVTTGGTGLGPRDVTPEATREVIDREVPGLAELMRAEGVKHTPMAALSRAVVGTLGTSLIVNLPGNPKAVKEGLDALRPVLRHALDTLHGDTAHKDAGHGKEAT